MSHGEDAIVCAGCEKEEADENKVIECVECHRYWHTKCKKLYGSTARRARSKPFLCSTECSELRSSVENDKKAEGLIAKVLSEVQCMRQEHAESNRELRNAFKELEKSQSFLAEKFEGINNDIKDLKLGQHFLKGQVDEVQESRLSEREDPLGQWRLNDRQKQDNNAAGGHPGGVKTKEKQEPKADFRTA
ncbi:conserved hypothetical protein [Culex quinquefasciatus]|uniref:Uncharacterized protein n=1 Tax=Culex quinquefasciatus TaxID=7176 RepID=B0WCZ8_CULQU|nr:conserved hypothetical protein [Culex quinquefasciatus]|eukprot:XP_001846582.1 conserved hypothetical protein [Culex quinquefasciatus]